MAGAGRGLENKTILFGRLQRDGDAITKVVPNAARPTLLREIGHNVRRGSTIHTDEHTGHGGLAGRGCERKTVDRKAGEHATEDGRGTQGIDGCWSRLKDAIRGTHASVSEKHLRKHAWEVECRCNSRRQPKRMLDELLSVFPPPAEE
ncbi:MAG TPA: transposase [Chloroflexota bacterium]|nr:transposase [Chloroflexota bacterium]